MKNWWPSVLAAVVAVVTAVAPWLQTLVSHHPALAAVLGALYAILAHVLPSPVTDKADSTFPDR
jgi:hypothetical protein